MAYDNLVHTLSAPVAFTGTFVVAYPAGKDAGSYAGGFRHEMYAVETMRYAPTDFTIAFGPTIVVTWRGQLTLPTGTVVRIGLHRLGAAVEGEGVGNVVNTSLLTTVLINLGAPDTASANSVCLTQGVAASTPALINGAMATGGVATFDQARNVVAAWTNTAILNIVGTDVYGKTMNEASPSGVAHVGKKAFKTITAVLANASVTGLTVGVGDVLGLPLFLSNTGAVVKELQDGAVATAGVLLKGDTATPTSGSGDVRGTYDPNAACNGALSFALIALVDDPTYQGGPQFG
jgi:hypothetical protein